jgi:O-methyltransferase involved in polyketide biosynthesis
MAAGFDTRPYRLDVSTSLRWIEADLPALTEEKEWLLKDAQPLCQSRRIKVGLADSAGRVAILKEAVGASRNALVITEGLLLYLRDYGGTSSIVARWPRAAANLPSQVSNGAASASASAT